METKGALRSKRVIGALLTIGGVVGAQFVPGIDYDPDAGNLVLNLPELFSTAGGWAVAGATGGGGILFGLGSAVAKKAIRGLW